MAEKLGEVAIPEAFVSAVDTLVPVPWNNTLAPVKAGAVKVTVTLGTGAPRESLTVATSGLVNG